MRQVDNKIREDKNFRDLSGYETIDGKRIKSHLIYRSCYLGWMNHDELEHLKDLGIKTVLDLRTSYEAYEDPDPIIDGIVNYRVSGMRDKNGEGVDFSPYGIHKMVIADNSDEETLHTHMAELYRNMMFQNEGFMFILEMIKQGIEFPLLFHCATGKDRTGAIAVLLYLLLGVSKEDIMEDYLLSNQAYHTRIELALEQNRERIQQNPSLKRIVMMEAGVDEQMGREMLDGILERYPNYEEFFLEEYGIDTNMREYICNIFLE